MSQKNPRQSNRFSRFLIWRTDWNRISDPFRGRSGVSGSGGRFWHM